MANKEDYDRATAAVRAGVASKQQEELAAKQAKQAGSWGNEAREAFKNKN